MTLSELSPGQLFVFHIGGHIYKVVEKDPFSNFQPKLRTLSWKWRSFVKWPLTYQVWIQNVTEKRSFYCYSYHKVIPV